MFMKHSRMARRTGLADKALLSTTLAALAISVAFWVAHAGAQSRGGIPEIEVAGDIMVAPGMVSPLDITLSRMETLPQHAMLLIRGLPPRVTLSEGRSFSPGVWAVPAASIGKLEMAPAHGTSGRSNLTMELVTLDGKLLAQTTTTLYILPSAGEAPDVTSSTGGGGNGKGDSIALTAGPLATSPANPATPLQKPASLGAQPARLSQREIENAVALMGKGDENMKAGKIAAARLFYKSAAESGYAPAALALGATYDGQQLAQRKVVGIQADAAQARKWYEKAEELGSSEASRWLQNLR